MKKQSFHWLLAMLLSCVMLLHMNGVILAEEMYVPSPELPPPGIECAHGSVDCTGTCLICGATGLAQTVTPPDKLQHEWGEVEYTKKPSCLYEGFDQVRCIKCGYWVLQNFTPKLTDHEPVTKYVEDCYGKGNCSTCDICDERRYADDFEWYDEPQHEWTDTRIFDPTCMGEGSIDKYCARCDEWYFVETIPVLTDHEPVTKYVEDCYGKGNCSTCDICDERFYADDFAWYDEPQHEWGEVEYTQKPSCLYEGYDEVSCIKCGYWDRQNITPKLTDHEPVTKYVEDCYGKGNCSTCDICDVRRYADDFAWYDEPQHEWGKVEYTQKPSCLNEGYDLVNCIKCGEGHEQNFTPKLTDHAAPTETTTTENCEGIITQLWCDICDDGIWLDFDRFPESKHDWKFQYAQEATCLREGGDAMKCANCGWWDYINQTPKRTDHAAPTDYEPFQDCCSEGFVLKCEICNDQMYKYTSFIDPPQHELLLLGTYRDATCLSVGGERAKCTKCDQDIFLNETPIRTDHQPVLVYTENCYGKGNVLQCDICNITVNTDDFEWNRKPQHVFPVEPSIIKTCVGEGFGYICEACGSIESDDYKLYDTPQHNFVLNDQGDGTEYVCTRCNEKTKNPPAPVETPTAAPTVVPTAAPTAEPTATPTAEPTAAPTAAPTAEPTATPTAEPTAAPTAAPTAEPTTTPTAAPTAKPTAVPTIVPTAEPTATPTPAPVPVIVPEKVENKEIEALEQEISKVVDNIIAEIQAIVKTETEAAKAETATDNTTETTDETPVEIKIEVPVEPLKEAVGEETYEQIVQMPVHEKIVVLLSVLDSSDGQSSLLQDTGLTISDQSKTVVEKVVQSVGSLDEESTTIFQQMLEERFPKQEVTVEDNELVYYLIPVYVTINDVTRVKYYAFCLDKQTGKWMFTIVEEGMDIVEAIEQAQRDAANEPAE